MMKGCTVRFKPNSRFHGKLVTVTCEVLGDAWSYSLQSPILGLQWV